MEIGFEFVKGCAHSKYTFSELTSRCPRNKLSVFTETFLIRLVDSPENYKYKETIHIVHTETKMNQTHSKKHNSELNMVIQLFLEYTLIDLIVIKLIVMPLWVTYLK